MPLLTKGFDIVAANRSAGERLFYHNDHLGRKWERSTLSPAVLCGLAQGY